MTGKHSVVMFVNMQKYWSFIKIDKRHHSAFEIQTRVDLELAFAHFLV